MSRLRDRVQDLERGRNWPSVERGRQDRIGELSERNRHECIDGVYALRGRSVPDRLPGVSDKQECGERHRHRGSE